jgi:transcriptional regulator with XRE-family HTH domain
MNKPDAYEKPDGKEIRRRRKLRGWSPGDLAREAKVGTSTVNRAEIGEGLQLRNLAKIADALGVRPEIISPRLPGNKSSVRVLDRWGKEYDLTTQAEKSVLILDSYFSEYGRLGSALRARSRTRQEPLSIEIYMASPDYDFGAQRYREMTALPILKSAEGSHKLLFDQLTDRQRDEYESHFHYLEEGTKAAARPYAAGVRIYEYRCMPGLRVAAIDDLHFVFGWFPLFAQNPAHTCFYLRDENLEGADAALLDEIRMQIENVKAASAPALKKGRRRPQNRRRRRRNPKR